jgi:hypothetical protein
MSPLIVVAVLCVLVAMLAPVVFAILRGGHAAP